MNDPAAITEALWHEVYAAFEKRPFDAVRTSFGIKGTANQVQFRLSKSITDLRALALKNPAEISQRHVDAIYGDLQLSETLGFMPKDTAQRAYDLLDKLTPKGS